MLRARNVTQPEISAVHLERGNERFLRDVHLAELAHLLLARLLLFQQLFLTGRVTAVTFRGHVLAHGADGGTRDDLATDRRLDGDLEQLPRDQTFKLVTDDAAAAFGMA